MSNENKIARIAGISDVDPLVAGFARAWASINPRTEAEAAVVADQIRLTRGATPVIDLLMPVAAVLVAIVCRHWVPATVLVAWVCAVALSCAGTSLAAYLTNPLLQRGVADIRRVAQIRTIATTIFLAAWATMGIVLWTPQDPVNHMFLTMVLATTLAGAASMLAAHPASVAAALAVIGGMLVLRPAAVGDPLDLTLAGLALIFAFLMMGQVRVVYAISKRARELECERHDMLRDLTKAKFESDRERARATEAGRTKSEFLSNMNHELRTPMNAILGFSELIKSKAFGDMVDKYTEYAEIIYDSGQHLLALINDMLDLAKIEGGKLTLQESTFAIAGLLKEVVADHEERAAAGSLTLTVALEPGLPQIDADQRAIRNIVANLLSNALKFTPPGGRVTVSARLERDGALVLAVEDTGIGIAPEDQLQVFERFGRGRHDVTVADQGTGLGLAIVKSFAEAHDGEVILESEPGTGTRVSVYLPAERVHAAAAAPAHAAG